MGEDLTAPFSYTWNNVTEGTYRITAKATDNDGLTTTSQFVDIQVSMGLANLAPTLNLTSPTNGSNFTTPATITLAADASDIDGTISKVEFFNGRTKLGEDLTAPYSFSWTGVAEGTYSITAKATDNGGLTTTTQNSNIAVTTNVANLAPAVSLTSPSNGSNFTAPATITLTADALDADGTVSKVEFFNGGTKLGEDITAPYSFTWNGVAEGTYSITAKVTDNGGLNSFSHNIEILINGSINFAPAINLTSPTNGSNFTAPATITLTADASDADGTVSKVEFFNGSTKLGEDFTAPYGFTWNNVSEGAYSITAKATDNAGLSAVSQNIEITLKSSVNLAPAVSLTSPTNGSNFTAPATIMLTADASDADGTITKIEFFSGSTKLGEDFTAPYTFSWSGVTSGSYSITAKATDNGGLTTTSQSIDVAASTGAANLAPAVNLTSPTNGSNFTSPATITLTADASDADGTVSKVEFFSGSTKLGEDLTAPYSFSWTGVAEGTYSISAKASDNAGLSTLSFSIYIVVKNSVSLAPVVNITSPANGNNFAPPATVTLTAEASDMDGTISKVEFFNGSTKLGEDLAAPYSYTWNNVTEGTYSITAKATDNSDLIAVSSSVTISVAIPVQPISPAISLVSLTRGSFVAPSNVILTADASDADGSINKVEFFANGAKIAETSTHPYSISWNNVEAGVYVITAKATDNSGLTTLSAEMEVIVSKPKIAPKVKLTSPVNNTSYAGPVNITLTADALAVDATIVKVEFFNGTTKLGEDATAPYEFVWKNVPVGSYQVMAKASDDQGLNAISEIITATVVENKNQLKVYPNPFSTSTTVEFSLTTKAYVELQVYNSAGVFVATAFKGIVEGPVLKRINFNGSHLPQGTYFCRLIYNDGLSYFKNWLETKIVILR